MFLGELIMIELPFFKKNKFSYLYNNLNFLSLNESKKCKNFLGLQHHLDRTTASGTNHTYSPTTCFARFPIYKESFPIIGQCRFFYSWDRPDILVNVFEDCIIFLVWAVWVLFNFYLKQKQRFQSGSLLKMSSSSPSMEEFGLDIQKLV